MHDQRTVVEQVEISRGGPTAVNLACCDVDDLYCFLGDRDTILATIGSKKRPLALYTLHVLRILYMPQMHLSPPVHRDEHPIREAQDARYCPAMSCRRYS